MKGSAMKEPPALSGQQVGGMHATGMLSCLARFLAKTACK